MKEFDLGILFVHGIGSQPPRETLVRWGDTLLKVIARATENSGRVTPIALQGSGGDRAGDHPAEVAVDLHYAGQTEKWLLAEAWWAGSFPAPTYSELVSWCTRAVPWSIALHIAQRYWQAGPQASRRAKLVARCAAVVRFIVVMSLAPVLIALLGVSLLLGLLPIPQLRSLIISTQTKLVGTVGESLAFVESPLRAVFIRSRILNSLERVQGRCERTVVVAHSQGAAAVLDAIGGIIPLAERDKPMDPTLPPKRPVPQSLVTFGSGINQLVSLKVLSEGLPNGANPSTWAAVALTVTILFIGFLVLGLRTGTIAASQLGQAVALCSGWVVAVALLQLGADWLLGKLVALRLLAAPRKAEHEERLVFILMTVAMAALLYIRSKWTDDALPILPISMIIIALASWGASLATILSASTREIVTKPVRKPPGLVRWIDLYSSKDPVPNGPVRIAEPIPAGTTSVEVRNRGSILSDHTTYWENLDGFVLRVAQACATTAESPWQDKLLSATQMSWVDRRAAWRVGLLRSTRLLNWLLCSIAFAIILYRHGANTPVLLSWWLPTGSLPAARFTEIALTMALLAWLLGRLVQWSWSVWVRAEQEKILAHANAPAKDQGMLWLIPMGIAIAIPAMLVSVLALELESGLTGWTANDWLKLVFFTGVGAVAFAMIAPWLRPGPLPPDAPDKAV
jgi:hypothetical protein